MGARAVTPITSHVIAHRYRHLGVHLLHRRTWQPCGLSVRLPGRKDNERRESAWISATSRSFGSTRGAAGCRSPSAYLLCGDWPSCGRPGADGVVARTAAGTRSGTARPWTPTCGGRWCARDRRVTAAVAAGAVSPVRCPMFPRGTVSVTPWRQGGPLLAAWRRCHTAAGCAGVRYLEGLDVSGAAVALGCTEGTVKSQTHVAWRRCARNWGRPWTTCGPHDESARRMTGGGRGWMITS